MRINFFVVSMIFSLSGCFSLHSGWVEGRNSMIGTSLERQYWPPLCQINCLKGLWSPAGDNKNKFDDVVPDGVNTRYYVTWLPGCQYSVLVDPGKIILSWRYEVASDDKCIVW